MNTMKYLWVALLVGCLSAPAFGQVGAGSSEVRFDGSLQFLTMDDYDETMLSGQLTVNRFLGDRFSIGLSVRPMIRRSEYDSAWGGSSTQTDGMIFMVGRADLYLASGGSKFVPYLGGHGGFIYYQSEGDDYDYSDTTFTFGGQAGAKYFVGERTSFNVEFDLSFYTNDEIDEDVTVATVFFGYSVYF